MIQIVLVKLNGNFLSTTAASHRSNHRVPEKSLEDEEGQIKEGGKKKGQSKRRKIQEPQAGDTKPLCEKISQ